MPAGYVRQGQSRPSTYYVGDNGSHYTNPDDLYYVNNYGFNPSSWWQNIPSILGHWIGQGVNAYTESSSEFSRWYNSPTNQMSLWDEANVNPYEGFLSGNSNSTVDQANVDPLASIGSYIGNFISLAHGLADLRSKKLANDSSQIDLLRKQFENKWFFGDPGHTVTEEIMGPNGPEIVSTKVGYIEPLPSIEYSSKRSARDSAGSRAIVDKYNGMSAQYGIDQGYYADSADYKIKQEKWNSYDAEYRSKRSQLAYEWENFLKNEIGIDPNTSPWLTSFLGVIKNQSQNDSMVGRFLFGLLQFLKGNY